MGDALTWEEFERRWNATPEIKFAELIGGKVFIHGLVTIAHGELKASLCYWLGMYEVKTKHCHTAMNSTVRMLGDAPLPDLLMFAPERLASKCHIQNDFLHGAPDLIVEVCESRAAYEFHEKKDLYLRAGVNEYLLVSLYEQEVHWHRLEGLAYTLLESESGIIRSREFPGLWLNTAALLNGDSAAMIKTLESGLATNEHSRFVEELAARAKK